MLRFPRPPMKAGISRPNAQHVCMSAVRQSSEQNMKVIGCDAARPRISIQNSFVMMIEDDDRSGEDVCDDRPFLIR
jgi:hypothetical protein